MPQSKYKKSYLKQAAEYAKQGYADSKIAIQLKVTPKTFLKWVETKPDLENALKQARRGNKQKKRRRIIKKADLRRLQSFPDYVYKRLDPEVQVYWDRIRKYEKSNSGIEKIELMLQKAGKYVRQSIFIHCVIVSGFRISEALQKANVTNNMFQKWKKEPEFLQLFQDIDFHKGNFIEEALMDLIKMRDTSAIIHASKTFNRKRGYNEKLEIETIDKTPKENVFDKLPLRLKKEVRDELRKQKENE